MSRITEVLEGRFWTDESELSDDIQKAGFDIADIGFDYLELIDPEDDMHVIHFDIVRAGRTIAVMM